MVSNGIGCCYAQIRLPVRNNFIFRNTINLSLTSPARKSISLITARTAIFQCLLIAGILFSNYSFANDNNDPNTQCGDSEYTGTIHGRMDVSNNGGAQYTVPIDTPPGINNLQPNLKLQYNSNLVNGLIGVGWSLIGLRSIKVCPKTIAQDGVNNAVNYTQENDRYCLNGQRLIAVEDAQGQPLEAYKERAHSYGLLGTMYHTELESWSKVVSVSGQNGLIGFKQYDRSGRIFEYGLSPTSNIAASGTTHTRVWALNKVTDGNNNYITYSYVTDSSNGSYAPLQFQYTGNGHESAVPTKSIYFNYESRKDIASKFLGGYPIVQTKRMHSIQTFVEDKLVKTYQLDYDYSEKTFRSRIRSVTVCDSSGDSLPKTFFTWNGQQQQSPNLFSSYKQQGLGETAFGAKSFPMDANADGISDLVLVTGGSESDNTIDFSILLGQYGQSPDLKQLPTQSLSLPCSITPPKLCGGGNLFSADVNGDGFGDFIWQQGQNNLETTILIGDGSKFLPQTVRSLYATTSNQPSCGGFICAGGKFLPSDINGDGQTDVVYAIEGENNLTYLYVLISNGKELGLETGEPLNTFWGQTLYITDVNGDNMSDILAIPNNSSNPLSINVALSTSLGFGETSTSVIDGTTGGGLLALSDVNGDRNTDLIYLNPESSKLLLLFSDGNDKYLLQPEVLDTVPFGGDIQLIPLQLNEDGMSDLIVYQTDNQLGSIYISNGTTLVTDRVQEMVNLTGIVLPMDLNGDSKSDLLSLYKDNSSKLQAKSAFVLPQLEVSDLVVKIINGLGGVDTVDYKTLTDSSIYTQSDKSTGQSSLRNAYSVYRIGNGARFVRSQGVDKITPQTIGSSNAIHTITIPRYVVSEYSRGDGRGNQYRFSMSYSDGLFDNNGRGWLGFGSVNRTDYQLETQLNSKYFQVFPLTFRLQLQTRNCAFSRQIAVNQDPKCASGETISGTAFDYSTSKPFSGVYQVSKSWKRKDYYDYGSYNFSLGEKYIFDPYLNLTRMANLGYVKKQNLNLEGVNLSTTDDVYTYKHYYNSISNWRFGIMQFELHSASDAFPTTSAWNSESLPNKSSVCMSFFGLQPNPTSTTVMKFRQEIDHSLSCYAYDAVSSANLSQFQQWDNTNRVSLTTTYIHDQFGNRTHRTTPAGNAAGVGDPDDHTIIVAYDSTNTYPKSRTSLAKENNIKLKTSYEFDPRYGIQTSQTDQNGHTFKKEIDNLGRTTSQIAPNSSGDPTKITTQQWTSDSQGIYILTKFRTSWELGSTFHWKKHYIDGLSRTYRNEIAPPHSSDGQTIVSELKYFNEKLVASKSFPYFQNEKSYFKRYAFDAYGRQIKLEEPYTDEDSIENTSTTVWRYKNQNSVTEIKAYGTPHSHTKESIFGYFDGIRKTTNLTIQGGDNSKTTYAYNRYGQLGNVTDPIGVESNIQYDSLARRCKFVESNVGTTVFVYDARGRFKQQLGSENTAIGLNNCELAGDSSEPRVTKFSYDNLGRKTTRTTKERTVKFYYDLPRAPATNSDYKNLLGKLSSVDVINKTDADSTIRYNYGYDTTGSRSKQSFIYQGYSYTSQSELSPTKKLVQHTYADGSIAHYYYQPNGYLKNIELFDKPTDTTNTYAQLKQYSEFGTAKSISYGDGIINENYSFYPWGALKRHSITNTGTGKSLYDQKYVFNPNFLLKQVIDQNANSDTSTSPNDTNSSQSFTYDNLRLSSANSENYGQLAYKYDTAGNILLKDEYNYIYSPSSHQLTSGTNANGDQFTFDNYNFGNPKKKTALVNGNLLTWNYVFDTDDNLIDVSASNNTGYHFVYNQSHQRVVRDSLKDNLTTLYPARTFRIKRIGEVPVEYTKYVYGPTGRVASITTKGSPERPVASSLPEIVFRHKDHTSSNTLATDWKGNLVSQFIYKPYGSLALVNQNSDSIERKFGGKIFDQNSSLYYFGARYYDPEIGRFISADNQLGSSRYRQDGYNRYAYTLNDPVNYIDPTGHLAGSFLRCGIGSALGIASVVLGGVLAHISPTDPNSDKTAYDIGIASAIIGGAGTILGISDCIYQVIKWKYPNVDQGDGNVNQGNGNVDQGDGNDGNNIEDMFDNSSVPLCEGNSFTKQTLVSTDTGLRTISEIKINDLVWSADQYTGEISLNPVVATHKSAAPKYMMLVINEEKVITTPGHLFQVADGTWKKAGDLEFGELLSTRTGNRASIAATQEHNNEESVFNLTVHKSNNFFVSSEQVLVHNDCGQDELSEEESEDGLDGNTTDMFDSDSNLETTGSASADTESTTAESAEAGAGEAEEIGVEGAESAGDIIADVLLDILEFLAALF